MNQLNKFLDDIESRLDAGYEEDLLDNWRTFAHGKWTGTDFCPQRSYSSEARLNWPEVNINDTLNDEELMILLQFSYISNYLASGFGGIFSVRANYGVGTIPSLFGTEIFKMPDEANTLPNVKHLGGGKPVIDSLIDSGIPDFGSGLGKQVFAVSEHLCRILNTYPNIGRFIRQDHPDCQGPMDVCELIWGSDLFTALVDYPETVHALLRLATDTIRDFLTAWFARFPSHEDGMNCYFGLGYKGRICIRDDSAMNLSPQMYKEFIFPYNQELLDTFGGSIHSCGKVDHFTPFLAEYRNLNGFHMSQPELNDVDSVIADTAGKGIPLLGLSSGYLPADDKVHNFISVL